MIKRHYKDYREYTEHQSEKAEQILSEYSNTGKGPIRQSVFESEFAALVELEDMEPGRVLCLGARFGEEVKAWKSLGYDAIGIDLNPVFDTPDVVVGDFHDIAWPNGSFDYVWSNSIDHALYPEKMLDETYRVLKARGKGIFEIKQHISASVESDDKWEAFFWESQEEMVDYITKHWNGSDVMYHNLRFFMIRGVRQTMLSRPCIVVTK